jgi:uncharacterized membrane protein YfcA
MLTDPTFYAFALPAVFLIGISKGGFGGGAALLAVPLMAFAVPPLQAAGILLPILVVMDIAGLIAYRRDVDRATLIHVLPGAILGTGIGWLTATWVTDTHVRLMVGVMAVAFVLLHWFRPPAPTPRGHSHVRGNLAGFFSGFTSFISHAGGPPFQIYIIPLRLEPKLFAGTSIVFFAVLNAIKVPPYFFLGQFTQANLTASAVLLPLAIVSVYLGVLAVRVISAKMFYRIAYISVFLVGLKLTWDGVTGLIGGG